MTLTNGAIPDALLTFADGAQRLRIGTASRWALVSRQVQARYGWTPHIVSGYRSLALQVAIFTARYVPSATGSGPFGDVRVWNGVRYIRTSPAGPAAIPGTSNHGWGTAVDVDGLLSFASVQRQQFAAVAIGAGFSDAEGRAVGEPWHWVDTLDASTVSNVTATTGTLPTPPGDLTATPPEDDMFSDDDRGTLRTTYQNATDAADRSQRALDAVAAVAQQLDGLRLGIIGPEGVATPGEVLKGLRAANGGVATLLARDPQAPIDTAALLDAIKALPTETVAAIKAAL